MHIVLLICALTGVVCVLLACSVAFFNPAGVAATIGIAAHGSFRCFDPNPGWKK